jgi:hypothetical protein
MGTLADYFARTRYQPKYFIGDRVQGRWNGIPFVGTVGNDTEISPEAGPRISVFVDLPIKYNQKWHSIILVKHNEVRPYR